MTAFRSRWDEWAPKVPIPRSDKSDKSPFGTFGTSSPRPISGKNHHLDPKRDTSPSIEVSQKAPTSLSAKSDRSPFGTFGTSSPRHISGEIDPSDPKTGVSPSIDGSRKAPTPRSDKSDKSLPRAPKPTTDEADASLLRRAQLAVVPDLSDPEDIQTWLIERAAMREDSGTGRVDADKLAFDELLWLWHAANPPEHTPGQCAACGTTFEPPVMALPDGATVCDKPEHECLITYGNGRRMEAVTALDVIGIAQPAWWSL